MVFEAAMAGSLRELAGFINLFNPWISEPMFVAAKKQARVILRGLEVSSSFYPVLAL